VGHPDRLRSLDIDERCIAMERDSWIMIAAQVPQQIDSVTATKHTDRDDPDMVKLYWPLGEALDWPADEPRIVEIADIMERLMIRAVEAGELGTDGFDDSFVDLLDATAIDSSPLAERLLEIGRSGLGGWTCIERVPADRPDTQPGSSGQAQRWCAPRNFPADQRFLGDLVTPIIGVKPATEELGQLVGGTTERQGRNTHGSANHCDVWGVTYGAAVAS
jgi:hypothetical protein